MSDCVYTSLLMIEIKRKEAIKCINCQYLCQLWKSDYSHVKYNPINNKLQHVTISVMVDQ